MEIPEWKGDDFEALKFLKEHDIIDNGGGILQPSVWPFQETPEVSSAINYLCYEWDYAYGGARKCT